MIARREQSKRWWRERGFILHVKRGRLNERFIWIFTQESGLVLYRFQGGPKTYQRIAGYLSPLFPCVIIVRRSASSTWHRITQIDPDHADLYSQSHMTPEKLVFFQFCAEVVLRSLPQNQPSPGIYRGFQHLLRLYKTLSELWPALAILWTLYVFSVEGYLSIHQTCRICESNTRKSARWIWSPEHELFHAECAPNAQGYILSRRQWTFLVHSARVFCATPPEQMKVILCRMEKASHLFRHVVAVYENITGNQLKSAETLYSLAF